MKQEPLFLEDYRLLSELNSADFPLAGAFEIEFFTDDTSQKRSLRYVDRHLGLSVEFPWWTDVDSDLRKWSLADVPRGTVEAPYSDFDQGWRVIIWQSGEAVFIMEGDEDAMFHVRMRVPADVYLSRWRDALARQQ